MTKIKLPNTKKPHLITATFSYNAIITLGKQFIVESVELSDGIVTIIYTNKK